MVLADSQHRIPRVPLCYLGTTPNTHQPVPPTGVSPTHATPSPDDSATSQQCASFRQKTNRTAPQPRTRNPLPSITRTRFNHHPLFARHYSRGNIFSPTGTRRFTSRVTPTHPIHQMQVLLYNFKAGSSIRNLFGSAAPASRLPRGIACRPPHVLHRPLMPRCIHRTLKNKTQKHDKHTDKKPACHNHRNNTVMLASTIQFTTNPPTPTNLTPQQRSRTTGLGATRAALASGDP